MTTSPVLVQVSHRFEAPAARVHDAWLDPADVRRWLFVTPGGEMKVVEVDARVGGTFVVTEVRDGEEFEHRGTYLELARPHRIRFRYGVPKFSADQDEVTVDIRPVGAGCELVLVHALDPAWAEYAERTRTAWTTLLAGLERVVRS